VDRHQHATVVDIHGKLLQAAGALFRAATPDRSSGPIENDLEEAAHMIRIAGTSLTALRQTASAGAPSAADR